MGTQRQAEILVRIAAGDARPEDAATLIELGKVMTDTSIFGRTRSGRLLGDRRRQPAVAGTIGRLFREGIN